MCSYIKASPTVISDHPRDTPLALPPPAPVQQPLGGRVWGFPEDALEINHLLIRNLKIISMDNVCRAESQCEIKLWFTLGGERNQSTVMFVFLLPADRSSGWELLKPGNMLMWCWSGNFAGCGGRLLYSTHSLWLPLPHHCLCGITEKWL